MAAVQNWRKTSPFYYCTRTGVVSRRKRLRKYVARKFNLIKLMTPHGKSLSKSTTRVKYSSIKALRPLFHQFLQARLNTLPTIPIYCTHILYLFYNTLSFSPTIGCPSPSISTLPSLYLKLTLHTRVTCTSCLLWAHHFVSPPFQIQTDNVFCSLHCC